MSYKKQWEKVDEDFFKEMLNIHNGICIKRLDENDFDTFVLENKDKINNPDYLQIFSERCELSSDYYKKHFDMCDFFYQFMKNNPDWQKLDFGLRTYIRLGVFEDTFAEYLENNS